MQIEQKNFKKRKIIIPLVVIFLLLLGTVLARFLLNKMNTYIDENGKTSMGAVIEQIQQTYNL